MTSPRRALLTTAVALLASAASASAADFYVDDNGAAPPTPGCQDSGHPCTTIAAALTASRAAAGTGDTIHLAFGTYDEDVVVDQPQDNGLTIVGERSLFTNSVISHVSGAGAAVQLGALNSPYNTGLTLKDLVVNVPVGSDDSKIGIYSRSFGATLDDVSVGMNVTTTTSPGVEAVLPSGTMTASRVAVNGKGAGGGFAFFGPFTLDASNLTVLQNGSSQGAYGIGMSGPVAHIADSIVRLPAGSPSWDVIAGTGTSLTLDSSLIEGGAFGLQAQQSNAGTTSATVRRSTIDVATAGADDGGLASAAVYALTQTDDAAVAKITVQDSLLVDKSLARAQGNHGTPSIGCTGSILPLQTSPSIACDAAQGNSFAAPGAVFSDASSLDYRLKAGSPAIDAAAGTALAAGEPAVDIAGKPRNADGNADCVIRPDLGAYEFQGPANSAPTATASGPAAAAAGDVLTFTATGSDAEDTPDKLSYSWAFSDGGSASGASAQHAFTAGGSQSATVTVTDTTGCSGTATVSVLVSGGTGAGGGGGSGGGAGGGDGSADRTPPVLWGLAVKVRGLSLRYRLSEPASVGATVARRTCRKVAGRRRCRMRRVASFSTLGIGGTNRVALLPHLKVKRLPAGRYRVTLRARDAAGNPSKARSAAFRVR